MSEPDATSNATQRWLSNSQMRSALLVVEELLGRTGRTAVLRLSGLERYIDQLPPANDRMEIPRGDITALFSGISSTYGDQGARGVLRRWGRAYAVRRVEPRYALRPLRLALRLMSPEQSARFVLTRLLRHIDLARADQPVTIDDRGEHFFLELADCLYCYGQSQPQPNCPAVVGMLEGLLRWASGNDHEVTEERPAAPGAALFKIRKRPIGRR